LRWLRGPGRADRGLGCRGRRALQSQVAEATHIGIYRAVSPS